MPFCVVKQCSTNRKNKDPNVVLHVFPKDINIIRKRLQQTGQHNDDLDAYTNKVLKGKKYDSFRMCSRHFTEDNYWDTDNGKKVMKPDALPTLFEPDPPPPFGMFKVKHRRTSAMDTGDSCMKCG